jgi:hypothetical protein
MVIIGALNNIWRTAANPIRDTERFSLKAGNSSVDIGFLRQQVIMKHERDELFIFYGANFTYE